MMAVWSVLIFVSLVSADVPELRGTVEVKATHWVIPVDEGTLSPVPVYLDEGSTGHPRTLSPGACQIVASAQPPRSVTVRAHDARMAVVQYHATGFLDRQECEDGTLVQVPAGHVHEWVLQAEAQARRHTERSWGAVVLMLALGVMVLLAMVRFRRALHRPSEQESRPSTTPSRTGEPG
jgi:hypothetical protein